MYKSGLFICLLALSVPLLYAQEAPQATKVELPSGESIMDKYIEATGGIEAYKKIKNSVAKGTMMMPAMGISANLTIYSAEPNLQLQEAEIPGMGKMLEGVDGKIAWSYNPMSGPSIKTGKEGDTALLNAEFREENWRKKYSKIEALAIETVQGEECYKVQLTPNAGDPRTSYYSIKSGLLLKHEATTESEIGTITIEILVKDYKKVGELLMPHRMEQKVAGQELTIVMTEIKNNVDIPKSTFDPPAEVKALLNR
ncbi:MAG: hypothetical protein FWG02_09395 [Holophagaceae bacterium]|nr:hypothetical protein [Holophagaceae bacterium]